MIPTQYLQDYPLFAGLGSTELSQISPCLTKRTFAKNDYLYQPDNQVSNVYLIESGLVRLFFVDSRGKEYILEIMGPSASIGLPMLHHDQILLIGAVAIQPSVVLMISKQDLAYFAARFPPLMQNIYQSMDQTLRKLLRYTQILLTLNVDGRLAMILLYLNESRPAASPPDEFELPITQEELAHWLGASRGHLNRTLKRLQQLGLIYREGRKITILDPAGLHQISKDISSL